MSDTPSLADRIAAHVFDIGTFNADRPKRIAFMVGEHPREREFGGLCESALARVIAEALLAETQKRG